MRELAQLTDDHLLIDEVGAWSEEKYRLASLYASMFTRSTRTKFDSLVYIDLLAGPGRVKVKGTSRIYASSPMNAPAIEPKFDRLVFCEKDDARMDALMRRCGVQYSDRVIHFIRGWMGVSVESKEYTFRIADLRRVPAVVRFLSIEPFLGPIPRLPLQRMDWVIAGGESGPHARPCEVEWIREIRDRCGSADTFLFLAMGGKRRMTTNRLLDGRTWVEFPAAR